MSLDKKIIEIRKNNNLTQEDFANILNVSRQTVSNWENSKCYPDIETLILISDRFNVSLDILLKEDKNMARSIDKKVKNNSIYKMIIVGFILIVLGIFAFVNIYNYVLNKDRKEMALEYFNTAELIEIYDYSSNNLITKLNDKNDLKLFINKLDIKNWKNTNKTIKHEEAKYLIKLYQNEDKKEELLIYDNGDYVSFYTDRLMIKEFYKTNINIELLLED